MKVPRRELPSKLRWMRWLGWAFATGALTRHHLLSYGRMARAKARNPSLHFLGPCFIGPNVQFEVRDGYARLIIEPFCHIVEGSRLRAHEGTLRIGRKTIIGSRNVINTWIDIEIGANCLLGDDIYVCDFDHVATDLAIPIKDQGIAKSPVRISENCWLGTKVVVTRGSELGEGCVVAAASVVRGVYPARSVIAGVPGKIVRTRG